MFPRAKELLCVSSFELPARETFDVMKFGYYDVTGRHSYNPLQSGIQIESGEMFSSTGIREFIPQNSPELFLFMVAIS